MPDNVSKLKIVSFADPKSKDELGSMDALLNPESYNHKIEIKYSEKQAPGTSGKLPKFSKIEPSIRKSKRRALRVSCLNSVKLNRTKSTLNYCSTVPALSTD